MSKKTAFSQKFSHLYSQLIWEKSSLFQADENTAENNRQLMNLFRLLGRVQFEIVKFTTAEWKQEWGRPSINSD